MDSQGTSKDEQYVQKIQIQQLYESQCPKDVIWSSSAGQQCKLQQVFGVKEAIRAY